ncbi:MAG: hypothetical protein Fues2KO_54160 [Fuerstiella sp.]
MTEKNPYAAPQQTDFAASSSEDQGYGGIGRVTFIGMLLGLYFSGTMLLQSLDLPLNVAVTLGEFGPLVLLMALAVPRLINMGGRGWWALGMLVPVLNLLLLLRCIAAPEGYAKHRTLDPPGKVLLLSLVATVVLFVLVQLL